jgi:hypothetical protein
LSHEGVELVPPLSHEGVLWTAAPPSGKMGMEQKRPARKSERAARQRPGG